MATKEATQQNVRDALKIITHFSKTGFHGSVTLHFSEGRLKQEKIEVSASIRRFDGGKARSDRELDSLIDCILPLDERD